MVNHDQKNDSKIYHEIMPSLDQKIPYNRHETNSSKQVKFQYFFSWKFSTSIALEREKCSFEPRQSSIKNLPLPISENSKLGITKSSASQCCGRGKFWCLCPPQQITDVENRGNTPFPHKYLKFLFDNIKNHMCDSCFLCNLPFGFPRSGSSIITPKTSYSEEALLWI